MSFSITHLLLLLLLLGYGVPWLARRGVFAALTGKPVPADPTQPDLVPAHPAVSQILQIILAKLEAAQPLLSWEVAIAKEFRAVLLGAKPGIEAILDAAGVRKPAPPATPAA